MTILNVQNVADVKEFVENYINQDNACTAWPYAYVVQQEVKRSAWHDGGDFEYYDHQNDATIAADGIEEHLKDWYEIENPFDAFGDLQIPEHIQKYYIQREWEDVQWFFTKAEAELYLGRNAHNLNKTQLYVKHFLRNTEAEMILRTLFSIAGYDYDKERLK